VRANTAFSERHPESVENEPFSSKNACFRHLDLYATRRSLVENDRPPSFDGAPDGWDFFLDFKSLVNIGQHLAMNTIECFCIGGADQ